MKKIFLGLALLLPFQAISADDSVYTWGHWSQGIKPAAGPAHIATPAPAKTPNVNFRPNEHSAFNRTVDDTPRQTAIARQAALAAAQAAQLAAAQAAQLAAALAAANGAIATNVTVVPTGTIDPNARPSL